MICASVFESIDGEESRTSFQGTPSGHAPLKQSLSPRTNSKRWAMRLSVVTRFPEDHVPPMSVPTDDCVMCGKPLRPIPHAAGLFCGSALCLHRFSMLAAWQKCQYCTRPLTVAQFATGVCNDRTCRATPMAVAHQEAAERSVKERALAKRRRQRAAARHGIPREEVASYRLVVLPLNQDQESPLPADRRAAFEQHLRQNLAQARERIAAGEPVEPAMLTTAPDDRPRAERDAETALMNAGCITCRGQCCKLGGDHAFNSSSTMMRFVDQFPSLEDEEIVSRYLSFLGERTLTTGCVFQGMRGCTLPRDMRAGICNRFFCGDVRVLKHQFGDGEPVRAFIVNRKGSKLTGDHFVEIS